MQEDFHYYATYCAAHIAGYTHDECMDICYSAQLVDWCSKTFLMRIGGPKQAATTQLSLEMMDIKKDLLGLQEITRIWSSFHFLPHDLYANVDKKVSKSYLYKYRLICDTNSALLLDTVNLAKGKGAQAVGIAMHVLADTWAHRYFAGTPSLVINNATGFVELIEANDGTLKEQKMNFRNSPFKPDDLDNNIFTCSMLQASENAIMNLGHGRAGHLPDYGFIRYRFTPAWKNYDVIVKDNPADYYNAFCQMVYALKCLKSKNKEFELNTYAYADVEKYKDRINEILRARRLSMSEDWKAFGESLSHKTIEPFDLSKYEQEYVNAGDKDTTYLGKFILAALGQKSMVTNRIYNSKNPLAGVSINYEQNGLKGMKDYFALLKHVYGGKK